MQGQGAGAELILSDLPLDTALLSETPFEHVAADAVGLLCGILAGTKCILVFCHYAACRVALL